LAQLIVRNLNPELVVQLKLRAAEHGRSVEAEHRGNSAPGAYSGAAPIVY
jgi:plasmid stability protein